MNKLVKLLLTGTLAFATILTALPVTAVHASGNQYWTNQQNVSATLNTL